jgi:choline dehydrogenase-like flavoprotein
MMYVRGSDADYNDWAELVGDDTWNCQHMKRYMRKHQTLEPIDDALENRINMPFVGEHHGTDGPVRTSFNDVPSLPIEDALIKAADEEASFKKPIDPWSGDHIGFYNTLGSVVRSGPNKGKRSYAARGYLGMAEGRSNLKVLCEATVNKVNIEGDTATGVNFSHGGQKYDVKVKREVLVCGGTIQSPQILELSGIGNPDVLKAAGVELKVENREVGENFQDHALSVIGYRLAEGVMSLDALFMFPEAMEAAQKHLMEQQGGPLTAIASTQGFFPYKMTVTGDELKKTVQSIRDSIKTAKTDFEKRQLEQIIRHLEDDKSANLQMVLVPATGNFDEGIPNQKFLFGPPKDGKSMGITIAICLQYPVSRGSIHIKSAGKMRSHFLMNNND